MSRCVFPGTHGSSQEPTTKILEDSEERSLGWAPVVSASTDGAPALFSVRILAFLCFSHSSASWNTYMTRIFYRSTKTTSQGLSQITAHLLMKSDSDGFLLTGEPWFLVSEFSSPSASRARISKMNTSLQRPSRKWSKSQVYTLELCCESAPPFADIMVLDVNSRDLLTLSNERRLAHVGLFSMCEWCRCTRAHRRTRGRSWASPSTMWTQGWISVCQP